MANSKKMPLQPRFNFMWFWAVVAVVIIGYSMFGGADPRPVEGDWNMVDELVEGGYVERIEVKDKERASIYIHSDKIDALSKSDDRFQYMPLSGAQVVYNTGGDVQYFAERIAKAEAVAKENNPNVKEVIVKYARSEKGWGSYIIDFLPWILIIVVWIFIMRSMARNAGGGAGGGIMNVGKARAQMSDKNSKERVTFKDVAGLEEAKIEIMEIVDFLKKADKYRALGAKIPKGALLAGPPGTGKTLLAKAVAGEANVPFLSISGSDFVEMFVGVGASRVRDLFEQAKKVAPCIVFIDEIDAIGRARGKNSGFSGNDERENTLNQLLTEMDGFGSNSGVIILAATNRADILDKALMRAGRFDRQIHVELPDLKERQEILQVHLRGLKLADDFDLEFLAKHTPGFSGADLANVCNEAALTAARRDKSAIEKQDFLDAVDRIIGGLERKTKIITPEEKKSIAHHEAGHAAVSWLLPNANPLFKVTIVPRGQALGAAWYLPEERQLVTREQMMDEMCSLVGGRVAEEIVNGQPSTGALNDLERLTKMAYGMVTYYGMSEKIGTLSFYDSTGSRGYDLTKPYSEKTAELIDKEVKELVDMIHDRTEKILRENFEGFTQLAELLLEKEVIFADDLERIFGPRAGAKPGEVIPKDPEEVAEEPAMA